jgi:aarF domain-containing kinase
VFAITVIIDILTNKEEVNRKQRAQELLQLVSVQSPALIKAGQALASRSDLLPKEYLDTLQSLQDRCPPFATADAEKLFEEELGCKFNDVFELESYEPVAAASIGQVYKGRLRSNGAKVAIKIQRPRCEEAIAIDLFILRFYASLVQQFLTFLKRDLDLVSVIDDFGELIYREIDYRAEAVNAQRFAELYASIPNIFVPKVYTDLSTSKVLTMEWVDGARLNDKQTLLKMNLNPSALVDTLVQCSLRQLLENGFFHCDPHAGNLLAMADGKLCYLDFGMVSYVESSQRYSIIEAVVHLVNRDFVSLAELYKRIGFIPPNEDTAPIVLALEQALPDVLNAPVGELNFKNVIGKLGDVMYKFPFSLPPFYISIIRCLGVLEGLAIQVDQNFRIISDAYPYIASRLLTDPSKELQAALYQLLFNNGVPRWERLLELLEKASGTSDYDVSLAMDSLVTYVVSEEGAVTRELLVNQTIDALDGFGADVTDYSVTALASLAGSASSQASLLEEVSDMLASNQLMQLNRLVTALNTSLQLQPKPSLLAAVSIINYLQNSSANGTLDRTKVANIVKKLLREPVTQSLLARIISEVSARGAGRLARRIIA